MTVRCCKHGWTEPFNGIEAIVMGPKLLKADLWDLSGVVITTNCFYNKAYISI